MVAKDLDLPRYRPSGATRLTIVPAALIASAVAFVIGIVYGVVSSFIPLVFLSVFLVFGLGLVMGVVARVTCQYAHCRNRMVGFVIGAAVGMVALAGSYWIDFTLDKRTLLGNIPVGDREKAAGGTFSRGVG